MLECKEAQKNKMCLFNSKVATREEENSFIQGRSCYSTFGWVPSIASLIILLQFCFYQM